jgi:UDP-glucose:(heptosyl)LPS alpha-1,3-glucosyltransferase
MKPIRMANFNRHFSRKAGGAESYAVSLVEGLANRRQADGSPEFEVHVWSQTLEHHHPKVTYHKVPGPLTHPRWINQLLFAAYTWWKTRVGFDIIHSHENTWHGHVQTVQVRPIRFHLLEGRTGWRLWLRWFKIATSPRLAFYVWLEAARMTAKPHRVHVAGSQLLKNQMLAAYPHLDANIPIILPGVGAPNKIVNKTAALVQLGLPASVTVDTPLILFVGNDYARKGLPALLASVALVQANQDVALRAHVLVVGNAAQIPKFQLMAAGHGDDVAKRVHFVGPQSDMALVYRAADMLVHPTLEDGFAMVVLEAMSYGLPIVVSSQRYCGISQFLRHGEDALVLEDPHDDAAMAAAINQVMGEPRLAKTLSDAGLCFAAQYSWEAVVDAYVRIYADVLGSAIPPTTLLKPPST